jgi:hypothetical protein
MRVQNQKVANQGQTYWHHFGGKIDWFGPKLRAQRRAHDFENQDAS